MKIFHLSILTPYEVYTSILRIYNLIKALVTVDPFVLKVLPKLKNAIENLSAALGRSTDPVTVKILNDKDHIRDVRFIAFRDFCQLNTLDSDPAIAAAAQTVVNIIRELGWSMHFEGFAKQTSLMDALIKRMELVPASAAITTMGASERFTAMKTAHTDFEDFYRSKIDSKSKEIFPRIRDSRIAVTRYGTVLLYYIDMAVELDGGVFIELASQIDEIIVEFESMAHNRQTQNKNDGSTTP